MEVCLLRGMKLAESVEWFFSILQSNKPATVTNTSFIDVDKLMSNLADPAIKLRPFPTAAEQCEGGTDDNEAKEVWLQIVYHSFLHVKKRFLS